MRKEDISKMDTEKLAKKAKWNTITTGILILLVLAMIVMSFVESSEDATLSSKLLPVVFLPLVISSLVTTKKLRKELASRQAK